jgi:hypothetical protein
VGIIFILQCLLIIIIQINLKGYGKSCRALTFKHRLYAVRLKFPDEKNCLFFAVSYVIMKQQKTLLFFSSGNFSFTALYYYLSMLV